MIMHLPMILIWPNASAAIGENIDMFFASEG